MTSKKTQKVGPFKLDSIYQIDALEGLSKIPDKSIDLIVTDPPYNIASKGKMTIQQGKLMSTAEAWGAWDSFPSEFDYEIFMLKVISECYRVLKPGGVLYMFTSRETNGYYIRKAVQRGFTYQNQLAIAKTTVLPSWSKRQWRSAFELCFYVSKGRPKTFNCPSQAELVNLYRYSIRHKQTKHPTEKPLSFIGRLVRISSNPGDVVLDPFIGSGTTAVACKQSGRRWLGFEKERKYVQMTHSRLSGSRTHETPMGHALADPASRLPP